MSGKAELSREGAVARAVYSNPDEGLMDDAMEADLARLVEEVESDRDVKVCVHVGGTPASSSGITI